MRDERGAVLWSEFEHVALSDISEEYEKARDKYPPMSSPHDGWAVIFEEVDELWEWVKAKPELRVKREMYLEAKQIAAMALRFMVDLCDESK